MTAKEMTQERAEKGLCVICGEDTKDFGLVRYHKTIAVICMKHRFDEVH